MKRFAIAILLAGLALSGCTSSMKYAAEVNGSRISEAEFRRELNKAIDAVRAAQPGQVPEDLEAVPAEFVAAVLGRMVHTELLESQLKREGITISEADRAQASLVVKTAASNPELQAGSEDLLKRQFAAAIALVRAKGAKSAAVKCFVLVTPGAPESPPECIASTDEVVPELVEVIAPLEIGDMSEPVQIGGGTITLKRVPAESEATAPYALLAASPLVGKRNVSVNPKYGNYVSKSKNDLGVINPPKVPATSTTLAPFITQ